MSTVRVRAVHILATVGLGAVLVATPLPINLAALIIWAMLVARWVKRQAKARGRWAGAAELAIQFAIMSVLVLAAYSAPVKIVDHVKARRVILPKQAMTIDEVYDSLLHGISIPDDLTGQVIRFPSRDLTVKELIAAIEAQTPLRHSFRHCGNGYTILWGGDCSFGLSFRVPPR
jgi:hypothetical protein